jgi:hypothetical protein
LFWTTAGNIICSFAKIAVYQGHKLDHILPTSRLLDSSLELVKQLEAFFFFFFAYFCHIYNVFNTENASAAQSEIIQTPSPTCSLPGLTPKKVGNFLLIGSRSIP